jgi:hypothetical protein
MPSVPVVPGLRMMTRKRAAGMAEKAVEAFASGFLMMHQRRGTIHRRVTVLHTASLPTAISTGITQYWLALSLWRRPAPSPQPLVD